MDTAWANTTTPAGLPPQNLLKLIFQVRVFYHIILLRYCALSGTDHCDSVFITHRHLRVLASQHHEFVSGKGEAPRLHWASLHSLMLLQMTHEHMSNDWINLYIPPHRLESITPLGPLGSRTALEIKALRVYALGVYVRAYII